jgi:putative sterol carrier protein
VRGTKAWIVTALRPRDFLRLFIFCHSEEENFFVSEAVSIKPIFEALPSSLNKTAAQDANAVYQFNLSGEGGGQFIVMIKNGECTVKEGATPAPDATILATAADYMNIVTGNYPFGLAYINGRLKVEGNLRLVLRLGAYFAPQA